MERDELKAVWVIGENPADSEADINHARAMLGRLDHLVVQDVLMTRTAQMADVVLPAALGWAETDGTVTSSERRVQRTRAAVRPPGQARKEIDIIADLAEHGIERVAFGVPSEGRDAVLQVLDGYAEVMASL